MRQTILAATLVFAGVVSAQFNNATIAYKADLDCTSCIRGGYDFCISSTAVQTQTGLNWGCNQHPSNPEANVKKGSTGEGYVCSGAFSDQMSAIVNGCRPYIAENRNAACGSYELDLTLQGNVIVGIADLPVNTTCTYRAVSKCGYPAANIRVTNHTFLEDFDIAFSTNSKDNMAPGTDNDLAGWNFEYQGDEYGSFQTGADQTKQLLVSEGNNAEQIDGVTFTYCNGTYRNLWLSVTRTKVTPVPAPTLKAESEEFLSENARMLQGPTPLKFNDIEIGFTYIQGGSFGSYIKVASFALLAAVFSVFAF